MTPFSVTNYRVLRTSRNTFGAALVCKQINDQLWYVIWYDTRTWNSPSYYRHCPPTLLYHTTLHINLTVIVTACNLGMQRITLSYRTSVGQYAHMNKPFLWADATDRLICITDETFCIGWIEKASTHTRTHTALTRKDTPEINRSLV